MIKNTHTYTNIHTRHSLATAAVAETIIAVMTKFLAFMEPTFYHRRRLGQRRTEN